jgi:hypothetical protein
MEKPNERELVPCIQKVAVHLGYSV